MSSPTNTKIISRTELAKHNKEDDGWIVINDNVYDMSKFANIHPGGSEVLRDEYGKDSTEAFYGLHRHEVLEKFGPRLLIGKIEGADLNAEPFETAADISKVPWAESSYFRGNTSPFWKPEHLEFRRVVRKWLHENVRDEAEASEASGAAPTDEMFKKIADFGLLAMRIGPGEHLKYAPKGLPCGIKLDQFDYFYELIAHEEVGRLATPGFVDGIGSGMVIGLPPVLHHGADWMKDKVVGEVLRGEKRICLSITEPFAGSDVANIKTTAKLTPDGKFYVVNGEKKWITNGHHAHYFTTLVRTGGPGMSGLSMLLIERSEGLSTKLISTSYSKSAGTAYIEFKDVMVPADHLIGGEGAGFLLAMGNFVHERWMIIAYINAASRGILSEAYKWAHQRKAFGRSLLNQPVVRQRLAKMTAEVEAVTCWLEQVTYQMCNMDPLEQGEKLAATVSLLKYYSTRVAQAVSDDTVNLFGGRGITVGGIGKLVERFNRTYKFASM
jgi:alkylation response protein AidB-like acyl-CoA dehydrogenase